MNVKGHVSKNSSVLNYHLKSLKISGMGGIQISYVEKKLLAGSEKLGTHNCRSELWMLSGGEGEL